MGLDEEEIKLLRQSWSDLTAIGLRELGLLIFHRLFSDVPRIRTLFYNLELPGDQVLTLEAMRSIKKMSSHATRIATSISKFIKLLDQPVELKEFLNHLGEIHASHKVEPEDFEYLAPVMLAVIGGQLNLKSDSPILQAWVKAYGILRNGIVRGMYTYGG
uniref:Globin domain-containing protein n=1 Tax=Ciona savignyi TaxID=51511 RepID=H2ZPV2_CIOSA